MSAEASPNSVNTGLQLCLDAANPRSYSGVGGTWSDISGNARNATLTNSPTFSTSNNGFFSFNGVNTYAQVGYGTDIFTQTADKVEITIDTFVRFTAFNQFRPVFQMGGAMNGVYFGLNDQNFLLFTVRKSPTPISITSPTTVNLNTWYHVVASKTATAMTMYINGDSVSTTSTTFVWNTGGNTQAWFGRTNSESVATGTAVVQALYGDIAAAKIYNIGLSAAQVKQNYNALKGRYGL